MNRILSAVAIFLVLSGLAFAQTAMRTTTLSLPVGVNDKSINLTSVTGVNGLSNGQVATILFVDKEVMYVQSVTGSSATVTRGQNGSDSTAHNTGATVYVGPPGAYGTRNLSGACDAGSWPVTPYINLNNGNIYTCTSNNWVLAGTGGGGGTNPTGNGFQSWNGSAWATRSFVAGTNITITNADGTGGNPTISASGGGGGGYGAGFGLVVNGADLDVNTAVVPSNALLQSGAPLYCAGSASNTATCTMTPTLTAYTNGQTVLYKAGATNTTTHTLNIDTLGAKSILTASAGALSAGDVTSGNYYELTYDGTQFRLPAAGGGGGGVTFNSPYMVVSGTNYLFGSYPATIPPASGSWTLASTQAADAIEAAGAALRVRMSTGSTAINLYSVAMGTSRTLTAVVMGDPAFSGDASCYVGTGRAAAGTPTFWGTVDNRSGGSAPNLLGIALSPSPTFSYSALPVGNIGYAPGTPMFFRFTITGGNTLHQKSGDYGLTWTTFATTANTTVFGGAVADTDLWYFGGRQGVSGLASSCTLLSWSTT